MIVCSCNVISDRDLVATIRSEDEARPRTPGQAYRCLGCAPNCGRCLPLINKVLEEARLTLRAGCDHCPGADADAQPTQLALFALAAE